MDGDAGLGLQDLMGLEGLGGGHVDWAHEPFGAVSADGEEGETRGRKFAGDFFDVRAEAGVAAEVDVSVVRSFDEPAAPESAIAVGERAAGEMLGGGAVDAEVRGEFVRVPPIEFVRSFVSDFCQAAAYAEGAENFGVGVRALQTAQSSRVEVVVVIVAEKDGVDWGKIFEAQAGDAMAFGADPLEGAGAIGPDRVG